MWNNILPLYFKLKCLHGIEMQQRPWPGVTKTNPDFTIQYIRNIRNRGLIKVVLIEDKRVKDEASPAVWEDAVDQVTQVMKVARASQFQPGLVEFMYAIVTVGRWSRFYELRPHEQQQRDYATTGGKPLEFRKHEDQIDAALIELINKTSS